ncbi:hypothetical protein REC12_04570 [Desulfosporosinus sp. PR]|uniref:hypothetical protein n=1 Tax=Candidatus Desulfosporosinus nitrosoreducens TaxID=3401928 RepID=UPI0027FDABD8|nr:hypothetical protein [Desulfosporosinus sp. PR]MDQ7092855.1 hypothetical protein [Desulfosporosinus sp. PR]
MFFKADEVIYQIFEEAGFTLKVTFEGKRLEWFAGLVAAKLGIVLISTSGI